ncbi:MAG: quinol dehydrogenase ferredoxin subunit NapH [Deltaproteobacteria bacterium]|nr:quinol dehydrogenase ferredoxin subunit NapH [Deltaproteobacteria bacterium]
MSWLNEHRFWLARRTMQLGILLLFWLGAHQHLGVLTGNLSASRVLRTLPLADPFAVLQILVTRHALDETVLLGAAIVLLVYLVVGGRSFCSWVCPVNLLTDFAATLRRRFHLVGQYRVSRHTRYGVLVLALLVSAISGVAAFEWVSPIAMIHRELIFGPGMGLLAIAGILLLDLYVLKHGWCGSLCPLGAFYALVGRFSLLRIGFDTSRCDHCGDCVAICPEKQVIDFHAMAARGFIDSGECTNCTRCLEVCPRDAYRLTLRFCDSAARHLKEGEHHATQSPA